ncbi:MAG: sulfur oxidation c-type cytochrome SoxX [Gammaproteobacteria bacterium]|nr:sulfur oxidation c-type cytochrome SoxX [Gammaproteobacteria bacterium]MCW9059286.1 sulfur oxidation c-type cytochrome SoxX [Gammaproteobacteria bacterium]
MMLNNMTRFATVLTLSLGAYTTSHAAEPGKPDYTKMSAEALAEHLVLESGSFDLDQPTQEGGTARERMIQDDLQKLCSQTRNKPNAEQAGQIVTAARASIQYPEGGISLGDWQKGGDLAWGGFGYRIGHNPDDHSQRDPSGNCYNCHALSPQRTGGDIGPSLTGYGIIRGDTEATRRFVYDMIYNPHAYFPCTHMPRMGAKGLLTQEAIADIMAYLLDPESPVNK